MLPVFTSPYNCNHLLYTSGKDWQAIMKELYIFSIQSGPDNPLDFVIRVKYSCKGILSCPDKVVIA